MTPPEETVFRTEATAILWHAADKVLEFSWRSFVSGPELREAFDEMLAQSIRLGARRWLTDYTELSALRLADQDWIMEEYTPRVTQQITLQRSAIVRPSHPLGVWFLDSMIARLSPIRPWAIAGFATRAAAYEWLISPESSTQ